MLRRSLLLPMGNLLQAMGRVSSGDLDARLPIVTGDELGTVAEHFNSMLAGLKERERLSGENSRLEAEIEAHLTEVLASRARVVAAADAERRRVERNLHDGAQQQLVALALELRLLEARAKSSGNAELGQGLSEAGESLSTALGDLRELARGLHPQVLATSGLGPALRQLALRSPVPVEFERCPEGRFADQVESTAYFVVSEALANVAKYAQASEARLSVDVAADALRVVVADDGVGGADTRAGSGLLGLTDRVAALGGELLVDSEPGRGHAGHRDAAIDDRAARRAGRGAGDGAGLVRVDRGSAMTVALVTGFTGFIGRRLTARLLADDHELRVVVLARSPLDRASAIAREIDPDRITVLSGDIAKHRLGLADAEYERLRSSVSRVFHLAAIYDLAVSEQDGYRANVIGTRNVLALCAEADGLERLLYVSTAYVAGTRTGVVREDELAMGQGFKNHYESTKYLAEVEVRQSMERIPTTIVRPSIVVGDSRTGETEKFDGPYFALRAVGFARRLHLPLTYFGQSRAPFNIVPVDYVVAAIDEAAATDAALGETLHLVDSDPLTARELTALLASAYCGRSPRGGLPRAAAEASLRLRTFRRLLGEAARESLAYLNHSVSFDTSTRTRVLAGMEPPSPIDYVGPLVDYFRSHEAAPELLPRNRSERRLVASAA